MHRPTVAHMSAVLLVPLALAYAAVPVQSQTPTGVEGVVAEASPAVVQILFSGPSGRGNGSGFIVESNGTILTNYHVVEGATHAAVRLPSGESYDQVEIVAEDPSRDIAVLRIAGFGLPTVRLGNSDSVRLGAELIAIGSPLGLENSVSTGVLSGVRDVDGLALLQTTAPISPGSSGGPLFNASGEVVGITVSQLRDGQNLNFAVPINYARGLLGRADARRTRLLAPLDDSDPASSPVSGAGSLPSIDFDQLGAWSGHYSVEFKNNDGVVATVDYTYHFHDVSAEGSTVQIEKVYRRDVWTKNPWGGRGDKVAEVQVRAVAEGAQLTPREFYMTSRWTDGRRWHNDEANVRVVNRYATGSVDSEQTGHRRVDRQLGEGVVLSPFTAVAFLGSEKFREVGSTFVVTGFDPVTRQLEETRYRVRDTSRSMEAAGRRWDAVEVEVSGGASLWTAYYRSEVPHVLLAVENAQERMVLQWFSLEP